jgi:hypothetical protein
VSVTNDASFEPLQLDLGLARQLVLEVLQVALVLSPQRLKILLDGAMKGLLERSLQDLHGHVGHAAAHDQGTGPLDDVVHDCPLRFRLV